MTLVQAYMLLDFIKRYDYMSLPLMTSTFPCVVSFWDRERYRIITIGTPEQAADLIADWRED